MTNLQDRVALITGGGTGIGAATAERFAADGATVAICGRRPEPLAEVRARLESTGAPALDLPADVADPSAARGVVERVLERFGRLDVLVHNAALYAPGAAAELDLESWRRHFDLNVTAGLVLAQAAHPSLRANGGVVVTVLSNLASRPVPGVAAYCASKAALRSLTESLALEWASDGIRVVGVSPGVVDTPIHGPGGGGHMASAHPLGRIGRPEEVAAAIAFLAGDESAWTTGSILEVGGGIHLA